MPWLVIVGCRWGDGRFRTIATAIGSHYAPSVRVFALVELGDPEAIDLYVQEKDARRAFAEWLRDEPEWVGMLYVKPIDLDERDVSSN